MAITKPTVGATGWNTATDALIDAVNALQAPAYGATDQGFLGWTIDPAYATNGTAVTAGVLYLQKLKVQVAGTTDTGYLFITTGGTSPTNCYIGLFNSSGTQVAVSANQATPWSSSGVKAISWSTPVAVTAGTYYFGILCGGGTPPAFARAASQGTGANGIGNVGLSAPGFRFGTVGTGQTAMPGSVTLSSVAGDNTAFFAAIST